MGSACSASGTRRLVLVHPAPESGAAGAGLHQLDDDDDAVLPAVSAIAMSPSVQRRFIEGNDAQPRTQGLRAQQLFSPAAPAAPAAARLRGTNRVSPFGSQSQDQGQGQQSQSDGAAGASGDRADRSAPPPVSTAPSPARDPKGGAAAAAGTLNVADVEIDTEFIWRHQPVAGGKGSAVLPRGQGDGQEKNSPLNAPADLNATLAGIGERGIATALPGIPRIHSEADTTAQLREHLKLAAELREQLQADGRRRERLSAGRGALQRCYAAHPGDPLACGDLVRAFASSVDASLRTHPPRAPWRTATP
ncbi:Chaperone protein DnaJ [Frankliniella fusca]|uniref:Chaperone protein DnaJ n=1 Tax=Frankliniella fusca TaxID=407009 RepID=A0AAE1LP99_9NEOP|nr:Chaperone protein DnaJ [Frankliniella fusca]